MNDITNRTTAGNRPGGQPGNTNGQMHGLFSRIAPPTVQELRALADRAIIATPLAQTTRQLDNSTR